VCHNREYLVVLELLRMKARGEEPDLAEAPERQDAPDLMAALEASLAARS
jgi:non-homologous end joining protein Ku